MNVFIVVAIVVLLAVIALWPPTPKALGRFAKRVVSDLRVLSRAKRNRTDYFRWLLRRPALLAAINAYETSLLLGNGLEPRVKYLASVKASSLTGCPF